MCTKAAIGAILVLCSTAGAALSAPISYVVSPGSGTLAVGDTVTVTFTFDPSQLSYPPGVEALGYGAAVYFDDRYFAFASRGGISTADAGDSIAFDVGTMGAHAAYSSFSYQDRSPIKGAFTYSETFMAIGGTPETDVLTGFQPAAAAWYLVAGMSINIVNVGAFEFYDVTPHVPEPSLFALSSIALAASGAWRARKIRRSSTRWNDRSAKLVAIRLRPTPEG